MWHQLECLWPARFGSFWDFVKRYAIVEENEWTKYHIHGLNEENAPELSKRLEAVSYRVTAADVAHLMPPFSAAAIRIPSKSRKKSAAALKDFAETGKIPKGYLEDFAPTKIIAAIEFINNTVGQGKRVVALTHLHETGETLEAKLGKSKFPVWRFDGRQATKIREKIIQTALREPKPGALICTMHSVKEGINTLAGFDAAILVEMYYTPGVMSQVIKRFHRINAACNVWILYIEGSHEEVVAERLRSKINEAGQVLRKGHAEITLDGTLGIDEEVELAGLRAAAQSMMAEDFSFGDSED